jgi:D-3-phosphoglycerate dehydrogenase / 2-oxoglutarate reductase
VDPLRQTIQQTIKTEKMKKVLVATEKAFAKEAVTGIKEIIEAAGYQLALLENYTSKTELLAAVADADALIIRSDIADKEVLEAAAKLKIVVRAGAGYDNIDLGAASAKGVVAMNTPGQNANAVAELVFGMMIMNARKNYTGKAGTEIKGKKIGIHAYGNIGKIVATIAKGFGMEVYAYDPFVKAEDMAADGVKPASSIEELYSTCQYVSLHIPATPETKKSINQALLSKMPKDAVLVNTARKEVIDEDGLVLLMDERKDFNYLSDIEPANASLLTEKFGARFFCTPKKMGAQTEEANINAGYAAAKQIVDFFEKGDIRFKVNK